MDLLRHGGKGNLHALNQHKIPRELYLTPISNAPLEDTHQGCSIATPKAENSFAHASNKRLSQDESDSSHGDRNFKRVRACPSRLEDTNSPVVEISDNVGSPSRTLTTLIKENVLHASSLEEVQVILKDVDLSPLMKLLKSIFELTASYEKARSTLHDKDVEVARKKLFIAAGKRLSNAMFEEHEKIKSFIYSPISR
ncbi:hypothetical protein RND71_020979 [Anisodus tanguticus]|uniref:Uncharacterized protein n=1 Tax=Anisodus tanguticus TaxID=243964 RepID=A0AAE1VFQ1_9SOLA|nr:hypothetical protein RND71_020979 [Anisodus tanguticus]